MGVLGLSEDELGEMTPRSFQNKLKGYNQRLEADYFFQRQMAWLQIRVQGAKVQPEQIWPLSLDDNSVETELPTSSETEEIIKLYKKANPKLFRPN